MSLRNWLPRAARYECQPSLLMDMERSDEADRNPWAMFTMTLSCPYISRRYAAGCSASSWSKNLLSMAVVAVPLRASSCPPKR
jgi:hypothetical protein